MDKMQANASPYAPQWDKVKSELLRNDSSADQVAVLEADKIFSLVLENRDLPGKDDEDRIRSYARLFSNPDQLRYARAMHEKLITQAGFELSPADSREVVTAYHRAATDLEGTDFDSFPFREKLGLFLRRNFYGFPSRVKQLAAVLIALCLLTFLLTDTSSGRSLVASWVSLNDYLFYRLVPALLALIALSVVLIGALYAWQNRKQK